MQRRIADREAHLAAARSKWPLVFNDQTPLPLAHYAAPRQVAAGLDLSLSQTVSCFGGGNGNRPTSP